MNHKFRQTLLATAFFVLASMVIFLLLLGNNENSKEYEITPIEVSNVFQRKFPEATLTDLTLNKNSSNEAYYTLLGEFQENTYSISINAESGEVIGVMTLPPLSNGNIEEFEIAQGPRVIIKGNYIM